MFAWIGAFIVMVSINLSMAIFDLCAGHYNPHKISETGTGISDKMETDFDF